MKMGPAAAVLSLLTAGFLVAPEAPAAVAVPAPATVPAAAAQAPPRAAAATLPSNPVDYAYDGAGQLRGVTQTASGGQSARYGYDDGGNLLSIQRSASSTLTVISVVPSQAPVGATVTISGTGFATTASANTVRFNGTAATVTQATPVRLTVTVPSGASSGAVTVTTSAGTATSAQPFTVAAAVPTPTVTALSPTRGAAGATVTVTGTGFDASPGGNIVSFGRTRARVTAATATSLTVTVPDAAGSGRVTVATAGGSATSGSDFVVVPTPYAATAIANTGVLPIDTGSAPISVPTAGQVAVWRFNGTKGQRLSLGLTGSTFPSNDFRVAIFSPYGAPFARDEFNEAWHYGRLFGGLALPPLPTTGTYQIVIDPEGTATGTVTAVLSSRVTGTLSLTGAGTTVALSRAGQQAELTIPAAAGQKINLGFTGATFASSVTSTAQVLEPHGSVVMTSDGTTRTLLSMTGGGDYEFTASNAGDYRFLFGTTDQSTGSVTVTASPDVDAGAVTVGAAKTVAISRPGQDARMTFAGTAGQRLSLDFTGYTFTYSPYVTVYLPDGTVFDEGYAQSLHRDLPDLPVAGTYTLVVSPGSSTGSFTLLISQRQDGGTLTTTGPAVTVTLAQAARTADLAFAATAGQRLSFAFSNWTFASGSLRARLYSPSGSIIATYDVGSLSTFFFTATVAGNHRLSLSNSTNTGSVAVTLSAEVNGGSLTVGTAKTVTASRPGQTTLLTFTGTAGQRLSLSFASYTFTYVLGVTVVRPDGTVFKQGVLQVLEYDLDPLPVAGTYQIILSPYAETGSAALTLRQRADAGATTVGGATKVLTTTAGQYVETSFTATANQRLSFGFTNWTYAGTELRTRVVNSAGGVVTDTTVQKDGALEATAGAAGTYRLIVYATGLGAGSVTLTLSEQLNAGTITLNTAKTVTISRAGQSARMTYAGTAGQNLALAFTNVTMTYYPWVVVRRPDGQVLTSSGGASSVSIATLPSTGTYEITIGPYSFTGSATLTLGTRSALATATADADGKAEIPRARPAPAPRQATAAKPVPAPKLRTPARERAAPGQGGESWRPDAANLAGTDWDSHRPEPTGPVPPALRAPAGKTAVSGRVLTLDAKPLPGVTVSVDGVKGKTDGQGRFLLADLKPGRRVLRVDGASANSPGRVFGLHDIGVDLTAGQTHVLPYTVWLSTLDTKHTVRFTSPTDREVVVTTPAIPGLEVRLPKGAVIRDVNGKVVTELGITALPLDRSPFPLPRAQVPAYFTVQPGSAYVFPAGARVVYPNFTRAKPGSTMDFWHYDPAGRGWFVYGHGTVTPDGKQVTPDKGTEVYQFTGAMLITPGYDPPPAQAPVPGGGARGGDPVDLGTGLLVDQRTDLVVDDVIPLNLTRTYQQSDTGRRSFGIGVNSDYDINLYSENRFVDTWLLLPDGGRVRYHRITPGSTGASDYANAAFAADPTPTRFAGSILAWNGDGWDLRMRDGTVYVFGDEAPLQEIRDRYGNTVTITRAPTAADPDGVVRAKGPIMQVTSPNGKWIKFSHDSANRITRAEDNIGRAVSYTYDPSGRLATVTDANGGETVYTYESGRLKTIRDARENVYLTNVYDANGRVDQQTLPDGGTFQFDYVTDASGRVTRTDLTDPRGNVRRVTFNAAGFSTSDTAAYGTPLAQTLQITRHPTTNLPTSYLDALNRRTDVGYDAYGNVTSVTELAGTAGARTTTIAYDGPFDQVSSVTDPLTHSTLYAYQANGALRTVTDPMSRVTTLDTNEAGQVTKVTDNDTKATSFGYVLGDLATVTDPLGRVSRWARDGIARPVRFTDPQGNVTRATYDGFSNVRTVTDPIGRLTDFRYDPNGNLRQVTDPRQKTTVYEYDSSDRLHTITDPLDRVTTYDYDGNGNPETVTSARGKVTSFGYDELDRRKLVRYGVTGATTQESQVTHTYDAGNRVRTIVDTAGGTTTVTPDDLDRVTRVVSPQGQIDYTYDKADRRATLQVSGQPQVVYGYNDANQLTSVARDAEVAAIGYDNVGRRKTITLPAGVTQTYEYDAASQVTSITYTRGTTTLGDLTYDYDQAGDPIRVAGSFARGTIPAAYGPASYDDANQIITNGVASHTYDQDGNLTSDGTATYTWNARGQLTTYSKPGLTVSYGYDGLGRRPSRDTGGVNTNFLYDGLNVAQEYTGTTPSARLLTGGIDEVFNRTTTGGDRSLLTDALGSTIAGADSHSIGVEYTYEPFGATTVSGNDLGNPTRFTGREDDPSGLYYYRARFYSPSAGRFISKDPIGLASGDTNPYTYVFNQPTVFTDPLGTKPQGTRDCVANSFTAGTQVLMADGSRKPIEQVKPGDRVMATDPESGESGARSVTAVIKGEGAKTLVDVTVRGQDGGERSLTATDGHPFWIDDDGRAETPDGRWIDAVELRRGQWLKTADGELVQVAGTHAHAQHAVVYNLTVQGLHTYYVIAGDSPILVHNCDPAEVTISWQPGMPKAEFARKAAELQALSDAGLLYKAPNPVGRNPSVTANYKADLIRRVYDQYGSVNPSFADALKSRILTRMDPDHIWELQLGGPDVASNLRMLDRFTNQAIGMRQIWPQIRGLADYTPIKIIVQGPS